MLKETFKNGINALFLLMFTAVLGCAGKGPEMPPPMGPKSGDTSLRYTQELANREIQDQEDAIEREREATENEHRRREQRKDAEHHRDLKNILNDPLEVKLNWRGKGLKKMNYLKTHPIIIEADQCLIEENLAVCWSPRIGYIHAPADYHPETGYLTQMPLRAHRSYEYDKEDPSNNGSITWYTWIDDCLFKDYVYFCPITSQRYTILGSKRLIRSTHFNNPEFEEKFPYHRGTELFPEEED